MGVEVPKELEGDPKLLLLFDVSTNLSSFPCDGDDDQEVGCCSNAEVPL